MTERQLVDIIGIVLIELPVAYLVYLGWPNKETLVLALYALPLFLDYIGDWMRLI